MGLPHPTLRALRALALGFAARVRNKKNSLKKRVSAKQK